MLSKLHRVRIMRQNFGFLYIINTVLFLSLIETEVINLQAASVNNIFLVKLHIRLSDIP